MKINFYKNYELVEFLSIFKNCPICNLVCIQYNDDRNTFISSCIWCHFKSYFEVVDPSVCLIGRFKYMHALIYEENDCRINILINGYGSIIESNEFYTRKYDNIERWLDRSSIFDLEKLTDIVNKYKLLL